ncbi:hypothetical protein [Actinoplanes sp. NPDC049316]|uniref:hypothetical protein n=1 Tax=Actinoplanes sp. NPDC049316 TaxID=3154727 RepID=UPI0034339B2B
MNTLVVVVWVLIGMHLVALAFAPLLTPKDPPGRGARVDPCLGPVIGLPPDRPAPSPVRDPSPDGVLQAQLFSGEISRDEYRAAMARLAEQDEREHPVPFA